jgi:uncharacterized repeat protein (TIGR03803 family)
MPPQPRGRYFAEPKDGSGGSGVMAGKHVGGAFWRMMIASALAASFVAAASAAEPKILFSFKDDGKGEHPWSSPVLGPDGALFGATYLGGANGVGTVYRLTPKSGGEWSRKVLHEFSGGDGSGPIGGVTLGASGKLYGTTESGGRGECSGGCGVVYELAPQSGGTFAFTVIHRFNKVASGVRSQGHLLEDEGILYGVTAAGGTSDMGTVFRLVPQSGGGWKHTILHSFSGGEADGKYRLWRRHAWSRRRALRHDAGRRPAVRRARHGVSARQAVGERLGLQPAPRLRRRGRR